MTRASLTASMVAVLGLSTAACGSPALTQIVIVTDSDLAAAREFDEIVIRVEGLQGADRTATLPVVASMRLLPGVLPLVHRGGPLGPITVTATARLGGRDVLSRRARTSFVAGRTIELRLDLTRSCVVESCVGDTTCVAGVCVSIDVDAATLPDWRVPASRLDGSVSFDAPEAAVVDVVGDSREASLDVSIDDRGDTAGPVSDSSNDAPSDGTSDGLDASVDAAPPDAGPLDSAPPDIGARDARTDAPCVVYRDRDTDGHGDPRHPMTLSSCSDMPFGYVESSDDCDDNCFVCRPGGVEVCDCRDNDCDDRADNAVGCGPVRWVRSYSTPDIDQQYVLAADADGVYLSNLSTSAGAEIIPGMRLGSSWIGKLGRGSGLGAYVILELGTSAHRSGDRLALVSQGTPPGLSVRSPDGVTPEWFRPLPTASLGTLSRNVYVSATGAAVLASWGAGPVDFGLGGPRTAAAGMHDIFLASYDETGAPRWVRQFGSIGTDNVQQLAVDPTTGRIAIAGYVGAATGMDLGNGVSLPAAAGFFVAMFDSAGRAVFAQTTNLALSVAFDSTGKLFFMNSDGDLEIVTPSFSVSHRIVPPLYFVDLAIDDADNLTMVGRFRDVISTGLVSMTARGGEDAAAISYSPAGVLRWFQQLGSPGEEGSAYIVSAAGANYVVLGVREPLTSLPTYCSLPSYVGGDWDSWLMLLE